MPCFGSIPFALHMFVQSIANFVGLIIVLFVLVFEIRWKHMFTKCDDINIDHNKFVSSNNDIVNDQRIVHGIVSSTTTWPFMVAIFYNKIDKVLCGGIIWNEYTVLTAAHCLYDKIFGLRPSRSFRIYVGHSDIKKINHKYLYKVRKAIPHHDYSMNSFKYDIALLHLDRPFDMDHPNISCVCEPEMLNLLDTKKCVAIGWGRYSMKTNHSSLILREARMPIIGSETCSWYSSQYSSHWNVCAGHLRTGGGDTCQGDSGGPLLCPFRDDHNHYSLVGITSYGSTFCGMPKSPGYYTYVLPFSNWLKKYSNEVEE